MEDRIEIELQEEELLDVELQNEETFDVELANDVIIDTTDKNYFYIQNTASNIWEITHNLNKYPSVTIIDSSGNEVIGDVEYNSVNQVTLTFAGAFKGTATLN